MFNLATNKIGKSINTTIQCLFGSINFRFLKEIIVCLFTILKEIEKYGSK